MYFEEIEQWTKGELSSHLGTMLATEQALHPDGFKLVFPVAVDTSSVLGGIMRVARENLPQYAIDCQSKEVIGVGGEDQFIYDYLGQITLIIGANSAAEAEAVCKRHSKVVERWIMDHLNPQEITNLFTIHEVRYASTAFSGAVPLESENVNAPSPDPVGWVAGAEVNLAWRLIESGPGNIHA